MALSNNLKDYFPLIRTREEVFADIQSSRNLLNTFSSFSLLQQEEFLDYCTGAKGVKILERTSCYSADLLLRQYKRVRDEKGKYFSYKDIRPVITIVMYENSPKEFHEYPDIYIHRAETTSDTGVKINLMQNYIFISLDIFRKKQHNKPIINKLDAWLAFFALDTPWDIIMLFTAYPEFKPLYEQIYQICRNTEDIMGIFSEELQILDDNTVKYMIDLMQNDLDATKQELETSRQELNATQNELNAKRTELAAKQNELNAKEAELDAKEAELNAALAKIKELESRLS